MISNTLELVYSLVKNGARVTTDSRTIRSSDIFIALKGETFDGNSFALQALSAGAQLAVVSNIQLKSHKNCVYIPDTLQFLQQLARHHRDHLAIPVIGLTGSNGKTTSKELISSVLGTKFSLFSTQGNLNNHIGVPLSVLSVNSTHQMAVIEMGANHVGEIGFLSSICKPSHGLITNIGKAHLEGFGSLEGVIRGKTELYQFLSITNGTVFFNADNPILAENISKYKLTPKAIPYGASLLKAQILSEQDSFLTVEINDNGNPYSIHTKLTGSYNVENILAAWTIGRHFGVEPNDIVKGIEGYSPTNSRSQVLETHRNTIILDAYNANPTSMEAAIESLARLRTTKPKVAILGAMLEMGQYSADEHRRIATLAAGKGFERVYLIGSDYPKSIPGTLAYNSTEELIENINAAPLTGKTILLKGSRGARMEQLLPLL